MPTAAGKNRMAVTVGFFVITDFLLTFSFTEANDEREA
jgi:hypothetical protein